MTGSATPTKPAPTAPATTKAAGPATTKAAGPWPAPFPPRRAVRAPGRVPLDDGPLLHLIRRTTYGATPELIGEVTRAGAGTWLSHQLAPLGVKDIQCNKALSAFPLLRMSSQRYRQYLKQEQDSDFSYDAMDQLQQATVMRAVFSKRQLNEVMVEFWSNHFNVTTPSDKVWSTRHVLDRTIRAHAFGRFEDLLLAVTKSPAMLKYLDNDSSQGRVPNENLGRELLELHTVGVDGGYTEKDVYNSALTLTGWSVLDDGSDTFVLKPGYRYAGHVRVMQWQAPNTDTSAGVATGTSYLKYLANHPHTARHLAEKLIRRFVSDTPTLRLVKKLSQVYLQNRTAIIPVLQALFASPEFWASTGQKVRRPYERAVASMRGLGYHPLAMHDVSDWANLVYHLGELGQQPLAWPAPNGYPDTASPWMSSQTTVGEWNSALALAGGWWADGKKGVGMATMTVRGLLGGHAPLQPTSGALVDGIAMRLLGQKLPPAHRNAVLHWYQEEPGHIPPDWKLEDYQLRTLCALVLSGPVGGLR